MLRAILTTTLLSISVSCGNIETNVCNDASSLLDSCGISLPVIDTGTCSGLREAIAICILDQAQSCVEVAALAGNTEACADVIALETDDISNIPSAPTPEDDAPEQVGTENNDDLCADGQDNDGDGYVDCDDTDCLYNANVSICQQGDS